ncbi:MAG: MBL fold metallo-hydrolase [Promethearchaeota archaeon]|jgi:glyoxylase-like metal-dependent hydrolase (beta-lactamase superfamily II)
MDIILNRLKVSGRFRTNCYLYGDEDTKEIAIIDPGIDSDVVKNVIKRENYKPIYLIGTHPHHDHIQCAIDIMDYFNIPLLINDIGRRVGENIKFIKENDVIEIGTECLYVIETPGHTRNDIMLIDYKNTLIFTGDTLLRGRIPRQLTNYNKLMASIRKILHYPKISDEFTIYPGHGGYSTIGKEKLNY